MHVRKAIRPRWLEVDAVPCCMDDVVHWAGRRGLELRPHDIVELRACIFGISRGDSWSEPFWLPELHLARGRWSQATEWAHDFDADGREWVTLPAFGLPLFSPDD